MNEALFEKLGLTKGEIKVYLALNKLEEASIGPIGKESKVSKSKIYDILERLIQKGLAGYITKEGTKYYLANDPHMILDYVQKKEQELQQTKSEVEKIIPQLNLQRATADKKRVAEIYEGFHGVKAIREELISTLNAGEDFLVLGAPKIANERWDSWFLNFHKRRIERKIKMKIIYNSDAQEYGKVREQMKFTSVKYLPNKLVSPN